MSHDRVRRIQGETTLTRMGTSIFRKRVCHQ